jgi:hypothetical protein
MKKIIPLLFAICAFVAYQIFFFCFINIISYQTCGVRLSMQENILSLSLSILVILLLLIFFYFLYNARHVIKTNKFNKPEFIYWVSLFFICWIGASVITAAYDIYYGNQVKTIYEYFAGKFKTACPIIWFMAYSILYDKFCNK